MTYETEVPSVESTPTTGGNGTGKSPTHHSTPNTATGESGRATGSEAEVGGGAEGSEGKSGGHKKEGSSSREEEGQSSTAGGGGGGKSGGGGGGQTASGISGNKPVAHAGLTAGPSNGNGGSSPVVPILIAVVVLAAISIGVVLYRQRKSGQGGSDGRVSSSNAS